jgi:hypothetical protein
MGYDTTLGGTRQPFSLRDLYALCSKLVAPHGSGFITKIRRLVNATVNKPLTGIFKA